ncbi:MAG TPA: YetF domain-containing protein [Puia sp.]|jgi:uncharacterized membrane protein YcaP (DUF421 family)|nr:YetF domain-containing protein [Puia sp.]
MNFIENILGKGSDLNALQMSIRGIIIFIVALLLIRISGRRSFGLHMSLDNIVTITLGAVMSRAIVGASEMVPVVVSCTMIVLVHRILGWMTVKNKAFADLIEGKKMILFQNGSFIRKNMDKAIVCEEDVMQGVRRNVLTNNLDLVQEIYIERNGEISALKK